MTTAVPLSSPVLTPEMVAEIQALFPRYPTRQAITLPALHIVNAKMRHVPMEAIPEIAKLLELAPAQIYDTLSFYGFFKSEQGGFVRAWVCRSISCALRGGDEVFQKMCHTLGVKPGGTTPDGKITLEFGECLGLCDFAPAVLANEQVYKNVDLDKVDEICAQLKAQATQEGGRTPPVPPEKA
jgi:NADH-quinone oxidoreductase subunit E